MTRQDAVIFDLDGTLADDRHRRHLLPAVPSDNPRDYDAYHAACESDPVYPVSRTLFLAVRLFGIAPLIVTRRPQWCRDATFRWLDRNRVGYGYRLHMAGDDETRGGAEWKASIATELMHRFRIICVFDDDPESIKMWKRVTTACCTVVLCRGGDIE